VTTRMIAETGGHLNRERILRERESPGENRALASRMISTRIVGNLHRGRGRGAESPYQCVSNEGYHCMSRRGGRNSRKRAVGKPSCFDDGKKDGEKSDLGPKQLGEKPPAGNENWEGELPKRKGKTRVSNVRGGKKKTPLSQQSKKGNSEREPEPQIKSFSSRLSASMRLQYWKRPRKTDTTGLRRAEACGAIRKRPFGLRDPHQNKKGT